MAVDMRWIKVIAEERSKREATESGGLNTILTQLNKPLHRNCVIISVFDLTWYLPYTNLIYKNHLNPYT